MLSEFLGQHEQEILQLCKEKMAVEAHSKPTSAKLEKGLPIFYRELIGVLERTAMANKVNKTSGNAQMETPSANKITKGAPAEHGKESLRLGYQISEVVHSYGAICQSITEFAQTKTFKITDREFQDLNLTLDCAIAEAVTEYEKGQTVQTGDVERLASLMNEMKNSVLAASASHEMIQLGRVGGAGVTSQTLSKALKNMLALIETALGEVRSGKK